MIKEMRKYCEENGIVIKNAKLDDQSKVGLHLLNPTTNEIENAIDTAARDLFKTIYIHTAKTWFRKVA